jgi:hypothetical protein
MFNNSPFTLCDNKTSDRYKYYYEYAIENLYDIKYELEKQKTNNNKLKYKNKMLKEENKNLHRLLETHTNLKNNIQKKDDDKYVIL